MEDLTEQFRTALRQTHGDVDIETRSVTSDQYEGVDFCFRGTYVPVRPLINTVAETEDRAIESISFIDETDHGDGDAHLSIFVADLSHEQPHPAFVN
jgi:hypothetical protein